jgi:hypothetical protein
VYRVADLARRQPRGVITSIYCRTFSTKSAISGHRAHEFQMKKTEAGKKQPWTPCSRLMQINSERRSTAV